MRQSAQSRAHDAALAAVRSASTRRVVSWHLKDWVKHDPEIPKDAKARIKAAAEGSRILAIANDMANGTKHRELRKPQAGAGAYYSFTQIKLSGPKSELETVIEVDGIHMTSSAIAKACVEEWERILTAEGLPIESMGRSLRGYVKGNLPAGEKVRREGPAGLQPNFDPSAHWFAADRRRAC